MPEDIVAEIYDDLQFASQARLRYTVKAFRMIPRLTRPNILDIGCGQGGPTLELAKLSNGQVFGLDNDLPSLERLKVKIEVTGLSDHVNVVKGSMLEIAFPDKSFDIIWSEGSIHAIGFERGLDDFYRLIKPEGFLVVHETVWPHQEPPHELREHWQGRYREVSTTSDYISSISTHNYELIDHFTLPDHFWWNEYYLPRRDRILTLREKYQGNLEAQIIFDKEEHEIDLFKRYQDWYRSAFFVMQIMPK